MSAGSLPALPLLGLGWAALGLAIWAVRERGPARRDPWFPLVVAVYSWPLAMTCLSGSPLGARAAIRLPLQIQAVPFLFGPALYFYCRRILGLASSALPSFAPHALPFVLLNAAELLLPGFVSGRGAAPISLGLFLGLANAASVLAYGSASFSLVRRHAASSGDYYSSDRGRFTLRWLERLTLANLACFGGSILALSLAFLTPAITRAGPEAAIDASIALFVFAFSLFGHEQAALPESGVREPGPPPPKYAKSALGDGEAASLFGRLEAHMREAKPFLDPELRLGTLAEGIGAGRHALSQAINERAGENFYSYVNAYRAAEFLRALEAGRHRSLSFFALALDCGFNSQSAFYAAIKKATGKTPKELAASAGLTKK